nr:odorant receptor SameORX [Schistocerca americana]
MRLAGRADELPAIAAPRLHAGPEAAHAARRQVLRLLQAGLCPGDERIILLLHCAAQPLGGLRGCPAPAAATAHSPSPTTRPRCASPLSAAISSENTPQILHKQRLKNQQRIYYSNYVIFSQFSHQNRFSKCTDASSRTVQLTNISLVYFINLSPYYDFCYRRTQLNVNEKYFASSDEIQAATSQRIKQRCSIRCGFENCRCQWKIKL